MSLYQLYYFNLEPVAAVSLIPTFIFVLSTSFDFFSIINSCFISLKWCCPFWQPRLFHTRATRWQKLVYCMAFLGLLNSWGTVWLRNEPRLYSTICWEVCNALVNQYHIPIYTFSCGACTLLRPPRTSLRDGIQTSAPQGDQKWNRKRDC